MILVTQKQVLEFYIIAIECKTLDGLMVPHTAFPKCITTATKATTNTTTRVHVTKAVIGTRHPPQTQTTKLVVWGKLPRKGEHGKRRTIFLRPAVKHFLVILLSIREDIIGT